jgi:hypothetical protein
MKSGRAWTAYRFKGLLSAAPSASTAAGGGPAPRRGTGDDAGGPKLAGVIATR